MDANFSAGAVPRGVISALNERSDRKGLAHLASHLAAIVATGLLEYAGRGTWWLMPAMFVQGIPIVFLFTTLHEVIHRTAFKSRWLNEWVSWFCGLAVGLPPIWFRAFHFAHHRHTQIDGADPELDGKQVESWRDYLIYPTGWRYWVVQAKTIITHSMGQVDAPFVSPRVKPRVVREARVFLAVYGAIAAVSIATSSDWALIYWVLPSLLAQPILRAYLLAEHTGCPKV